MTIGKEKTMTDKTTKTQLPLTLELAEPKLIAGEVDIQLCCCGGTRSTNESNTINVISYVVIDASVDVQVDDNDF